MSRNATGLGFLPGELPRRLPCPARWPPLNSVTTARQSWRYIGAIMGNVASPTSCLWLLVAFAGDRAALAWARRQVEQAWGPIAAESDEFEFCETDYYARAMGAPLWLRMWVGQQLFDPACLAERKLQTNLWEAAYCEGGQSSAARPLNLDPGYLSLAKLVLASTKDHLHRIYLSQGIYGEVTLHFTGGRWVGFPWTYPNYQRPDYHAFFSRCRDLLRQHPRSGAQP